MLLPNMRSALIPAAAVEVKQGVTAATAVPASELLLCSPVLDALPAASVELRSLHCRMSAMLVTLTVCGCRPYHVRVLRLATVALESLCKRDALFANRDTLAQQIGCTRDVLQWVHRFDLSGHTGSCSDYRRRQQAAKRERAAAESRRPSEWQKAAVNRDVGPTQLSEFARHSSSFSYPSSECTA